jgi:hypothetical protein
LVVAQAFTIQAVQLVVLVVEVLHLHHHLQEALAQQDKVTQVVLAVAVTSQAVAVVQVLLELLQVVR